jgi:hypothetical protein
MIRILETPYYLQTKSVWINNGPGGGDPFIMKTAL